MPTSPLNDPTSARLVLVPTLLERDLLTESLGRVANRSADWASPLRLCGFGPIVSAAMAATIIGQRRPRHVVLAGIAGTYTKVLAIGGAYLFGEVGCFGVGAGSGTHFQPASRLGWKQWGGADNPGMPTEAIGDVIQLDKPPLAQTDVNGPLQASQDVAEEGRHAANGGQLLTVTSAAADRNDCRIRLEHFPDAAAEDMEAFGVAVACKIHNVPLTVVRGISNRAGDRDQANWQIKSALESVADVIARLFAP